MLRLSAKSHAEIRGTVIAIKTLDRDLRKQLRNGTKKVASVEWTRAMTRKASTTMERRALVDTARVAVSDQNVRIRSATTRRPVASGGLRPIEYGTAVEFGVGPGRTATYTSQRKGTRFKVTRNVGRHLRPRRGDGYVFYPAAAEMIPRLASMWVQTTVRTIAEALEAGGRR